MKRGKMKHLKKLTVLFFIVPWLAVSMVPGSWAADTEKKDDSFLTDILGEIGKLESNRDPKCHATATRLENFMYGTKLAAETRFLKVKMQKKILVYLWETVTGNVKKNAQLENNLA
ncbi:MAG: hypothetical protein GY940_18585, partial [bacterium]|nr:hypothetical protein [bacterium]